MRKQEEARLAELEAEKAHYEAIQSQIDIVSYKLSFSCWQILVLFLCLTTFCM